MTGSLDTARATCRSLGPEPAPTPAEQAEVAATTYYETGYWCGESVLKAVNEVLGHPLPPGSHRMASGFCEGLGGSRCICGALAGGVMASGLLTGRATPDDPWEPSYDFAGELRRRWIEDQDAVSCDEVVKRIGGMHLPERWAHCAMLVGRTARWVVEIAEEQGALDAS